jgi:7,8-dihydropterin-6-yl-methyl-4-(beta-D-ribofuranosyl)aminobenzene 5'-phosphate synthase
MRKIKDFGTTQDIAITVLVDNQADLMVESTDTVKRYTEGPLLAEHGFSALIDLKAAGVKILWDAGMTQIALLENMKRLDVAPASINAIALSHGHGDHTAAVTEVLKAMHLSPSPKKWATDASPQEIRRWSSGRQVTLVAHPDAFRERWSLDKDGTKHGPFLPPPSQEWEAIGAELILCKNPYELAPGCWTTGFVPRRSFEKSGRPTTLFYRDGDTFIPDDIEEDQAIILNVEGKGLVVLAGCAHSGIVNTVNYARKISGVDQVWAILGGFHLARATEEELERTIDALAALQPALIAPSHCTGFAAICRFATRMPDAFVHGVVGTTYLF